MNYIHADCDMKRWEYCDNTVVMANADYYYTKEQTDKLLDDISGMTPAEVQYMINRAVQPKADKTEVNEIAEVVRQQGERILNTYTKSEVDVLLTSYMTKLEANQIMENYAKVQNDVLTLADNIN